MKKIIVFALVLFTLPLVGCTENDAQRVANKIDNVYETVRAVITDDHVLACIPDETLKELQDLEDKYLLARKEYRATQAKNTKQGWSFIKEMASYGSALVTLIKDLPGVSQYTKEITVAQATISTLIRLFG